VADAGPAGKLMCRPGHPIVGLRRGRKGQDGDGREWKGERKREIRKRTSKDVLHCEILRKYAAEAESVSKTVGKYVTLRL